MKNYNIIKLFGLIIYVLLGYQTKGLSQYSDKWISLKYHATRTNPHYFYLQDIINENLDKNTLGTIFNEKKQEKYLRLSGGTLSAVKGYLSKIEKPAQRKYPIILTIKELSINEKLGNTDIHGKCKIQVSFAYQRDTTRFELTTFQTAISFSRSVGDYNNYEILISKLLEKSLAHLDEWLEEEQYTNIKLVKNLKLIILPDEGINDPVREDTIFWSPSRKMTWDDFTGIQPKASRYSAQIFNNFEYSAPVKIEDGTLIITLTMKAYMLKNSSWTSSTSLSAYSIAHEQLHFDITKLIIEKFKAEASKILTLDDYDSELQRLFIDMYREMNRLQKEYDEESNHSINIVGQEKWRAYISQALKKYITPETGNP